MEILTAPGAQVRYAAEQRLVQLLTGGRSVNLGVFLVTAEGQQLTDREIFRMPSAAQVLATLREALARFGPVTPRRVRPSWQDTDRGAGVRTDGSVRLALCIRYTDRADYVPRPVFGHGLVFICSGFAQAVLLAVRPDAH